MPITDLPDKDNLVSPALQQTHSLLPEEGETPKSPWHSPVLLRLDHASTEQKQYSTYEKDPTFGPS